MQRAFAMQITLQVPEPHIYLMLGVGLLAIGACAWGARRTSQGHERCRSRAGRAVGPGGTAIGFSAAATAMPF